MDGEGGCLFGRVILLVLMHRKACTITQNLCISRGRRRERGREGGEGGKDKTGDRESRALCCSMLF